MSSQHSPKPGPKPGATPGATPGANPAALHVDPEKIRREVADILAQPAPTSQVRAEHFEAAHRVLHDALNASRNSASGAASGSNHNNASNQNQSTGR